jgi:hypothetical protein
MKWPRYRRVISLEIQVVITSQINKWANTDPGNTGGGIRCLGGVSIPYSAQYHSKDITKVKVFKM